MKVGPLKQIVLQGTSLCNLNCDYCYLTPEARRQHQVLTPETAKVVFDKVFASSVMEGCEAFDINWHAGEPLVQPIAYYKEIFSIIQESQIAQGKGHIRVTHSIQTNGTLINDEWCRFFKEFNISVGISLDGPEWLHDQHRKGWDGKGSHARTMQGIECLKKQGMEISVFSVLTKDVLDRAEEWFHFFINHGIQYMCFNIDEVQGDNHRSSMYEPGMEEQFRVFLNKIWHLNKQQKNPLHIREFNNVSRHLLYPETVNKGSEGYLIPFQTVTIDSQGNFSTFPTLLTTKSAEYGGFIVGNFHTDTFESASQSDKLKQIASDIQEGARLCQQECDYFDFCGGLIWMSNKYAEHGTFLSTETRACRIKFQNLFNVVVDDVLAEQAVLSS